MSKVLSTFNLQFDFPECKSLGGEERKGGKEKNDEKKS